MHGEQDSFCAPERQLMLLHSLTRQACCRPKIPRHAARLEQPDRPRRPKPKKGLGKLWQDYQVYVIVSVVVALVALIAGAGIWLAPSVRQP